MNRIALTAIVVALAGCATQQQRPVVTIKSPFDEAQARSMLQEGTSTIKGSAFLRQRGGGVVTCAGSGVTLVPATNYAKERFLTLYNGSIFSGVNSNRVNPVFVPDEPAYLALAKTTTCDAQGSFEFAGVKEGEFFITTTVVWQAGNMRQGGHVMKLVSVDRPGRTVSVVISGD